MHLGLTMVLTDLDAESVHKFQMLQEVKVFGAGKIFWSRCTLMAISKVLLLLGFIFTKLAWMVHLIVVMHSTDFDARSVP